MVVVVVLIVPAFSRDRKGREDRSMIGCDGKRTDGAGGLLVAC